MGVNSMNTTATAKTDGLAEQAIWLTTAKVIGLAVSMLIPLVLVRTLSQGDFGVYKQAFQVLATATSLLNLQVASSMYYFMPRGKKPQVAMNIIVFYGLLGSLAALLCAFWPRWITIVFRSDDLVPAIPILGIAILLWLVSSAF